jgi:hypothetical protein
MNLRRTDGKSIAFRAILTAGFLGVFLLTLALSAAPRLHERVHGSRGAPNHECAVTLLATGSCEQTSVDAIAIAPNQPPAFSTLVFSRLEFQDARLFSLLEHAPPAIS